VPQAEAAIATVQASTMMSECVRHAAFPEGSARRLISVCLNTPWEGRSKKVCRAAHPCRYKPTLWPNEAYVSGVAYEFLKNRDHVRMSEFIGKRDPGKQANSDTGQNTGPDRFDTIGRKISANGHAESTFRPYERPIR
jgi:hypothetical protein